VSDDAVVLWVGASEVREDAARALSEWARARGVQLSPPPEGGAAIHLDPSIADRVERELDRAREAIGAADADTVERTLARIEAILREHPELPQAAWLRAEVDRTWAARWLRLEPRDDARARAAWEAAQALDGGRVSGIGEPTTPPRPKVKVTIVVDAIAQLGAALYIDGSLVQPATKDDRRATYHVELAPAEHQLLAILDSRTVFASWAAVSSAGGAPLQVNVADAGACARDQLAGVRQVDGKIEAAGVTCPRWIAAVPGERKGAILVARCEREICGPLLDWRTERYGGIASPPQAPDRRAGWPAWATFTILGVGAAVVTSVALVATGVFETRPVEPRFVVGGARQE
jgi:hypothetical protein